MVAGAARHCFTLSLFERTCAMAKKKKAAKKKTTKKKTARKKKK